MRTRILMTVMALAIAAAPTFGQVNVTLGVFERGHDVGVGVEAFKGVVAGFQHKESGGQWMQNVVAITSVSKRYNFLAGWHSNNLLGKRTNGPVAGFYSHCDLPAGFDFRYGARGYPTMDGTSRGAGWSVGVSRAVGPVDVYVGHDWDRFWRYQGSGSVKFAGVAAGVTFRLGG